VTIFMTREKVSFSVGKLKGVVEQMLLLIAIILVILWLLGFFVFSLGALIHIALVLAVILIIVWLLRQIFHMF
jgi:hypothetical protein